MNIWRTTLPALGLALGLSLPAWGQGASALTHPAWSRNTVIYEANIRQHSPTGSFRAFEAYVPELKKMGVGVVWLMPINPIGLEQRKGSLGSYYAVRDYTAVNPEFGSPADFAHLVHALHAAGIKVIIDWVANHTAWDHPWVHAHPDYYVHDAQGGFVPPVADWHDVIKLDYRNPALRQAMIESMAYWLRTYDIDGFRCDVAMMVPTDFWNEARSALDAIKPVFMLAEAEQVDLHAHAFDMTYAWNLKNLFGDIAQGKKTAQDLWTLLDGSERDYPADAYRMLHTSNHDLNSWEGTEFERLGAGAEAFLALTYTLKGMPLIYSGQEAGNNKRLAFFERDPIVWNAHPFRALYTRLGALKRAHPALAAGVTGAALQPLNHDRTDSVFAFVRAQGHDRVVSLFNLSAQTQIVHLQPAQWSGTYHDALHPGRTLQLDARPLTLAPWEYRIGVTNVKSTPGLP